MRKFATAALLSALALGFAAPVSAQPAFFARAPIQEWHGQHFTIIRLDQLERYDSTRVMLENSASSYPDKVAALQGSIRENRALADALQQQGVQINNVDAIQQGFNGGLVFYLR